ncbi:hypothetical protein ABC345_21205 [Shouchella sp. 1P09AA]|uniref:hypothetical protein n=1 Tax=unclassified Shouchella TaxID=2893065 RepID=UPI0039A1AC30
MLIQEIKETSINDFRTDLLNKVITHEERLETLNPNYIYYYKSWKTLAEFFIKNSLVSLKTIEDLDKETLDSLIINLEYDISINKPLSELFLTSFAILLAAISVVSLITTDVYNEISLTVSAIILAVTSLFIIKDHKDRSTISTKKIYLLNHLKLLKDKA